MSSLQGSPRGPAYNVNMSGVSYQGHSHASKSGIGPERTTYQVFNPSYRGLTYSVKYLGIVDGTMGILSRKMALQGANGQAKQGSPVVGPLDNSAMEPSLRGGHGSPILGTGQSLSLQPVLGRKNYTKTIG